jgi:hypothetical protein
MSALLSSSSEDHTSPSLLRVAFIGNSYTYFNDLPSMLSSMSLSFGKRLETEQLTVGGQTLAGHSVDARLLPLLSPAKHWDYVVLQDNSSIPGRAREEAFQESLSAMQRVFVPAIVKLAEKNPRLTVLLYESWGHQNGSVYKDLLPAYPDFLTMSLKTSSGYQHYQSFLVGLLPPSVRVLVVPVGSAFRAVRSVESQLFGSLYVSDQSHPSRFGTYLSACVFLRAILRGGGDCVERRVPMPLELRSDEPTAFETDRSEKGGKGEESTIRGITDEEMRALQLAADRASDEEEERQRGLEGEPCSAASGGDL